MKNYLLSVLFLLLTCQTFCCAQATQAIEKPALKYLLQLPANKTAKAPMVVLLHGYGSNEQDLFDLKTYFPGNYIVVSARAPYAISNNGFQWFEKEMVDGKYSGKKEHLDHSRKAILQLIAQLVKKYNADPASVYVMGFSQGAMMSYEVGLIDPAAIKGIAVMSGRLPESLKPLISTSPQLKKLKIFIAHGTSDTRLPFADGKNANDYLESVGLHPEFHSYRGMEHSISPDEMKDIVRWMKQ